MGRHTGRLADYGHTRSIRSMRPAIPGTTPVTRKLTSQDREDKCFWYTTMDSKGNQLDDWVRCHRKPFVKFGRKLYCRIHAPILKARMDGRLDLARKLFEKWGP